MAKLPFIGRLNPSEYIALIGSFVLVGLEALIRVLTLALPSSVINLFYRASRKLFNRFTSPAGQRFDRQKSSRHHQIQNASDFIELCELFGYTAEEHVVRTADGYLLGIHRLGWRRGEEDQRVNRGRNSIRKPVVYMHHGLMMSSEVWCCQTEEQRCLPFRLVENGYDVWLGNNRGNKYSKKSVKHSPTEIAFWNFSMDEFAFHDIPDTIDYILSTTSSSSLSYIGFSQGTAQAFASLAVHPKLNDQINVFIALAPAMSPAGLSNGVVDALVKASPQVLFLMFGRRSILSSATMWQSILYPPIFVRLIDMSLAFLFGWKGRNINLNQKLAAYPHLFSFSSTKSVVHWFQIIRNKCFQMYDDDVQPVVGSSSKYTKVARFPTRNIKTPIVLLFGGSDSLVDISVMLKELPAHTIATEIVHFEHLDFLWAREVDRLVFPHVFDALSSFCTTEHTQEEYARFRIAHQNSLGAMEFSLPRADHILSSEDDINDDHHRPHHDDMSAPSPHTCTDAPHTPTHAVFPTSALRHQATREPKRARISDQVIDDSSDASSPASTSKIPRATTADPNNSTSAPAHVLANSKMKSTRSSSIGSNLSFESTTGKGGRAGISIAAPRAISGVIARGQGVGSVTVPAHAGGTTGLSEDDGPVSKSATGKRVAKKHK